MHDFNTEPPGEFGWGEGEAERARTTQVVEEVVDLRQEVDTTRLQDSQPITDSIEGYYEEVDALAVLDLSGRKL